MANSIFGDVVGTAMIGGGNPYISGVGANGTISNSRNSAYDYERERMRQMEEYVRYRDAQMNRTLNPTPVDPKAEPEYRYPKAPDPLGFLNKADNKLLLTTGALE